MAESYFQELLKVLFIEKVNLKITASLIIKKISRFKMLIHKISVQICMFIVPCTHVSTKYEHRHIYTHAYLSSKSTV